MSFGLPRTPRQREAHELQNRERGKQHETTKRRSDEAMIRRFEAGLRERGIITNFAAASVATEIDGKPLGKTYLRDVLQRRSGRPVYIESVCQRWGISWDHVKTGKGSLLIHGNEEAEPGGGPIDIERLISGMESAFQVFGASPQEAAAMAKIVLANSTLTRSLYGAKPMKGLQTEVRHIIWDSMFALRRKPSTKTKGTPLQGSTGVPTLPLSRKQKQTDDASPCGSRSACTSAKLGKEAS